MKKLSVLIFAVLCLGIGEGKAQFSVLHNFNLTNGAGPWGSLTYAAGLLYGTVFSGGANNVGCIFSIDTNGGGYRDLYDFSSGINGKLPNGPLLLAGNKLIGTTSFGGTGYGNIFSIDTNGSGYKDLFDFDGTTGSYPYGSLTLSGNKLFGTTAYGGVSDSGCIFSIDTNGGRYEKLLDFNGINGKEPVGSLTLSKNKLFGTTCYGGVHHGGLVFSIDTNGNGYKNLYNYNDSNAGLGSLTLLGQTLFGMTSFGGISDSGTIFSIDTSGNNFKYLFDFNGTNGSMPGYFSGSLTILRNNLIGMTYQGGGHHYGCIFSIDTNGGRYADLLDFDKTNGAEAGGSLTLLGNVFYGATYLGDSSNFGGIFSFKDVDLGVNKLTSTKNFINLFPNPNNGRFTLSLSNVDEECSVEVYNIMGQKVTFGMLKPVKQVQGGQVQHDYTLDLSTQPSGVYFYRVLAETGELVGEGKVVIEK